MRRSVGTLIIGLELFALVLVYLQLTGGVRTDEAKYLLSIPYPHPPLLRAMMASTSALPGHLILWRFIIASATVQASWLVYALGAVLPSDRRIALVLAWLVCAPVILQGGSTMLVVPSALFGLILVHRYFDQREHSPLSAPVIALGWLCALFSVYQSALFAPLVFTLLKRTHISRGRVWSYFLIPVILLGLYSLSNPLALASMLAVSTQDAVIPLLDRSMNIVFVWTLSGGILTFFGLLGIATGGRRTMILTALLVLSYIALSAQQYYAFLLTPLLIGGLFQLFCHRKLRPLPFLVLHGFSTVLLLSYSLPQMFIHSTDAEVIAFLRERGLNAPILIDGYFGHQWQYYSPVPVRKYSQTLAVEVEDSASTIICTKPTTCEDDIDRDKWKKIDGAPREVWVKR